MNLKNKKRLIDTSIFAVFAALIVLFSWVPQIGFIQIPPVSLTIIPVFVLLSLGVLPWYYTVLLASIFGLNSWLYALAFATSPIDLAFQNFLVAVPARVFFGFVAVVIYAIFNKIDEDRIWKKVVLFTLYLIFFGVVYFALVQLTKTYSLGMKIFVFSLTSVLFIGSLILFIFTFKKQTLVIANTVILSQIIYSTMVLGALFLYLYIKKLYPANASMLFLSIISFNTVLETLLSLLICVPIYTVVQFTYKEQFLNKNKNIDEEISDEKWNFFNRYWQH